MIVFIEGTLVSKGSSEVVISTGGIGYGLQMSNTSIAMLPDVGSTVRVNTYMHVSDAGIALYGFSSEDESILFEKLIGISGIGPKLALAALSTMSPDELISAVVAQDVKKVSKIPGIGKKSASRIILELKDSLDFDSLDQDVSDKPSESFKVASKALRSMGFTKEEIDQALSDAPKDANEETLLQHALKSMG